MIKKITKHLIRPAATFSPSDAEKAGNGGARFLKNLEALALALGLKLYGQRLQKQAQLAAVKVLTERSDFPARARGLWPRASVVDWAKANLEVKKGGREFQVQEGGGRQRSAVPTNGGKPGSGHLTPSLSPSAAERGRGADGAARPSLPQDGLPEQLKPAEGELFGQLTPAEIADKKKRRLDYLEDIYLNPGARFTAAGSIIRLSNREGDELQAERPWLFKRLSQNPSSEGGPSSPDDFDFPPYVTNLETLAGYYKKKFETLAGRQFSCNKQTIKHWQGGKGVPYNKPWHPAPDSASRFKLAECFTWFEAVMLPKFKRRSVTELAGIAATEVIPLEDLRERDEREELEFNKWNRARERGEFVHKSVALATGIAAVKRIHLLVKAEDERLLPRLRRDHLASLGVALEIVAKFEIFDIELARSVTDKREQDFLTAT